jgi:hypothetical protein
MARTYVATDWVNSRLYWVSVKHKLGTLSSNGSRVELQLSDIPRYATWIQSPESLFSELQNVTVYVWILHSWKFSLAFIFMLLLPSKY